MGQAWETKLGSYGCVKIKRDLVRRGVAKTIGVKLATTRVGEITTVVKMEDVVRTSFVNMRTVEGNGERRRH